MCFIKNYLLFELRATVVEVELKECIVHCFVPCVCRIAAS